MSDRNDAASEARYEAWVDYVTAAPLDDDTLDRLLSSRLGARRAWLRNAAYIIAVLMRRRCAVTLERVDGDEWECRATVEDDEGHLGEAIDGDWHCALARATLAVWEPPTRWRPPKE